MSVDETTIPSRRERLAARRRRYRWTGVLVASVIVGAAGTVAAFAYTDADAPMPADESMTSATNGGGGVSASDTSTPDGEEVAVRPLSHEDPLRLWVAGDSLAGALGPALGERAGATGVVATHVDYKVSSGLEPGVRDWPEHAAEALAEEDRDAIVFMIGTNDASIVNSQDGDGDGVADWEPDYRAKVAAMMDLLVGDSQRTVIWIGAPTMRDENRDEAVVGLNRIMQEEAASRAPYVIYVDAYELFGDPEEDGGYTDRIDIDGETVRVRVGDGVHLTPAGAEYLAGPVFALLDGRFHLGAQADPAQPIGFTMAEGGESTGSGGSDSNRNSNGSGTRSGNSGGSGGGRSTTTSSPADEPDEETGDGGEPVEPTPTTVETPPPTDPPNTTPPTEPPPEEPAPEATP